MFRDYIHINRERCHWVSSQKIKNSSGTACTCIYCTCYPRNSVYVYLSHLLSSEQRVRVSIARVILGTACTCIYRTYYPRNSVYVYLSHLLSSEQRVRLSIAPIILPNAKRIGSCLLLSLGVGRFVFMKPGCGTTCLLWSLGVQEVVGSRPGRTLVRKVFHHSRKLVRFTLLKCHTIQNSKFGSVSHRPSASPSYEASSHVNSYAYSDKLLHVLLLQIHVY